MLGLQNVLNFFLYRVLLIVTETLFVRKFKAEEEDALNYAEFVFESIRSIESLGHF